MIEKLFFSSLTFLSIFFIYLAMQLPKTRWTIVGPEVWPIISLIGMLITSLILLLSSVLKKDAKPKEGRVSKIQINKVIATIVYIISYAVMFYYTGFFFSTIIATTSYLIYIGLKPWKSLLTSLTYALFSLLVFPVLLFIPLPTGFGIFRDITMSILVIFGR